MHITKKREKISVACRHLFEPIISENIFLFLSVLFFGGDGTEKLLLLKDQRS